MTTDISDAWVASIVALGDTVEESQRLTVIKAAMDVLLTQALEVIEALPDDEPVESSPMVEVRAADVVIVLAAMKVMMIRAENGRANGY